MLGTPPRAIEVELFLLCEAGPRLGDFGMFSAVGKTSVSGRFEAGYDCVATGSGNVLR